MPSFVGQQRANLNNIAVASVRVSLQTMSYKLDLRRIAPRTLKTRLALFSLAIFLVGVWVTALLVRRTVDQVGLAAFGWLAVN